ncbi:TerB family tellurite resistance protein [Halovulum dunhuangense]|uniref:TerB family tellurite resistance protein n=1 Tax=Halovulum dunhuangense TaxID=1505036 RepID=A0A849L415_9RHOB|nr:TerB family tellurite resistance protein [Halovulum dunhuangense]NNU80944.1 TerB family tellurite resistance protein [Halovulum dunhuangense]
MIADLFKRLMGEAPQADPEGDYRLSLAALLVRCARADEDYAAHEQAVIDAILMRRYGLDGTAAAALRARGEALEAEAGDTVHLTKAIKTGVPYEERGAIVESLWSVALADDDRDHMENAFLRLVVKLLGVNDVDSGLARQRAEAARQG